jgi:hypothetical protein
MLLVRYHYAYVARWWIRSAHLRGGIIIFNNNKSLTSQLKLILALNLDKLASFGLLIAALTTICSTIRDP